MKNLLIVFYLLVVQSTFVTAQSIGIGTNYPSPSSKLDISSTNSGLLPPRLTYAQRNSIVNPSQGLMLYCSNCDSSGQMQVFNGSRWSNLIGGVAASPITTNLQNVVICTQAWTVKNLDVVRYRNGDVIPQITDPTVWANATTGAWCWYNNDSATYGSIYGRLYNWYAVVDSRGLAPFGWHIPSDAEWNQLTKCLDPNADTTVIGSQSTIAGGPLKETGLAHWITPNGGATNATGFSALPAGDRNYDGACYAIGYLGGWWSTTEYPANPTRAYVHFIYNSGAYFDRSYYYKNMGFPVRLIKD